MQDTYIQDQVFNGTDFTQNPPIYREYENCIFNNCNYAGVNLSGFSFTECEFDSCNLSLVKLSQTALRVAKFKDCKMLGLRFDDYVEFGLSFSFEGCQLNHSTFYNTKIKRTVFKKTHLLEVDFTACDLSNSIFDNCELAGAVFENTNLQKADFRTFYNYSIDPEKNRVKKAKFSLSGISGLLDKYDIDIER